MATLTAANAIITLQIPGLFNAPQTLQGFTADDVTDTEMRDLAETAMGVDGRLSGGRVNMPVVQNIALQSDSDSNFLFDQWAATQRQINDILTADGAITLRSLGIVYTLTKGILSKGPPTPPVKRIIRERRYVITWESCDPSPI